MKFKSVSYPQLKTEVFTILIHQRPEYIYQALKVVMSRERLNASVKDLDNIKMIPLIFRETCTKVEAVDTASTTDKEEEMTFKKTALHAGASTSKELARVIQELAMSPLNVPALKNTIRKVLKSLGQDQVDIRALCSEIMVVQNHHLNAIKQQMSPELRADYFMLLGEIVCLILFIQGTAIKSLQIQDIPTSRTIGPTTGMSKMNSQPIRRGGSGNIIRGTKSSLKDPKLSIAVKQKPKEVGAAVTSSAAKSKEEMVQLFGEVQRCALKWCKNLQEAFDTENIGIKLYNTMARKILFLDILPDAQVINLFKGLYNRYCFL